MPDGVYTYQRTQHATFGRILKPTENLRVDRDVNHDGRFDDADRSQIEQYKQRLMASGKTLAQAEKIIERELDSQQTVYFHPGGARTIDLHRTPDVVTNQNTGSAGCQTLPRGNFADFRGALGDEKTTGQSTIQYTLVTIPQ